MKLLTFAVFLLLVVMLTQYSLDVLHRQGLEPESTFSGAEGELEATATRSDDSQIDTGLSLGPRFREHTANFEATEIRSDDSHNGCEISGDDVEPGPVAIRPDRKEPVSGGGNTLFVPDQSPGVSVQLPVVGLARPGYAVIHDIADDATPGTLRGLSPVLGQGMHANITVILTEPMKLNEQLVAVLHYDNYCDGVFREAHDPYATGSDGVVLMGFTVTAAHP